MSTTDKDSNSTKFCGKIQLHMYVYCNLYLALQILWYLLMHRHLACIWAARGLSRTNDRCDASYLSVAFVQFIYYRYIARNAFEQALPFLC